MQTAASTELKMLTLGIYQIGNLDTRRINVGANIKRVRDQQRPNSNALIQIMYS